MKNTFKFENIAICKKDMTLIKRIVKKTKTSILEITELLLFVLTTGIVLMIIVALILNISYCLFQLLK